MTTVTLSKPISHGDKEITSLTFHEPTVGDLIAGETVGGASKTGQVAATLAAMADIPYPVFKTISARDFIRIDRDTKDLVGNVEQDGTK
ncbi:phage tail assembly protein [Aminobacter sp. AP02]|uniref:phage tail assembly protein n=1 Tax=Aminobacter sp. AP02 TaxID=2135737 RepID=UPI000D6BED62|nr:phage tail assembly protein [Aminobacter sp. AP02]PWK66943.1 tail assembly chaperone E/41/14-like protein [Aminobacter sp. AP02]